jgi:hypothetical protein
MPDVGRLSALGSALLLVSVGLGGCGSTASAPQARETTSCPILQGVDLSDAHLSVTTFTPSKAANGSTLKDASGRVFGCSSPYGSGGLSVSFTGHLDGRTVAAHETEFKRFKSTGRPLGWANVDAVSMPGASGVLEIHFHAGDRFGSILCISDRLPSLRDAEALARALLRHSAPS